MRPVPLFLLLLATSGCDCHPNVSCDPDVCPLGCSASGKCLSGTGGGSGGASGGSGGAGGSGGGVAGACRDGGLCFTRCDPDAGVRGHAPLVPGLIDGRSAALADSDGDGRLDLAVADTTNFNDLYVSHGAAGGTFSRPTSITGFGSELLFADVTSDGLADLIEIDRSRVRTHVSLGDGGFDPNAVVSDAGVDATDAVLLKVDGDGYLDLAIATGGGRVVLVLQGFDGGAFVPRAALPGGRYPWQVASADVDGDGKDDLVAGDGFDDAGVAVFVSNGDFTFQAPLFLPMTEAPGDVRAADLDGDGHAEIYSGTVNGLWGWATPSSAPQIVPGDSFELADCDTDGDGKRELIAYVFGGLATFDRAGGQLVQRRLVMLGNLFLPDWLLCADLDRDGRDEVLAPLGGEVLVLWGGPGGIQAPPVVRTGARPSWVTADDLDGDGRPDLIAAMEYSDAVYVWFNQGGQLSPGLQLPAGSRPRHVVVADLDLDGKRDLVVANGQNPGAVTGLKNLGGRAFSGPMSTPAGFSTQQVATLDYDQDGKPDAVASCLAGGSVELLRGNGDGSFSGVRALVSATGVPRPMSILAADLDGDGRDDVAYGQFNANGVVLFHGERDGGFTPRGVLGQGFDTFSLASADFDHDGRRDLATGTVSVFFSAPDGGFRPEVVPASRGTAWSLQAVDVNADGWADLVAGHQDTYVGVLLNERDGGFRDEQAVFAGADPRFAVVADFDGDGRPELVSSTVFWPDAGSLTLVDGTCW